MYKAIIAGTVLILLVGGSVFVFITKDTGEQILPPQAELPQEEIAAPPEEPPVQEPTTPQTPVAPRAPQEFIVKVYSASRAEPANLIIRAGDTVTFLNEDNELHWPGADPHPTHSALPSFDALGGISKGQSYSHTFRKLGLFDYHEHLLDDPPPLGTITVLP